MKAVNSYIIDTIILPPRVKWSATISSRPTAKEVDGVEIKNGRLTGMLFEMDAMGLVTAPALKPEESLSSPRAALRLMPQLA